MCICYYSFCIYVNSNLLSYISLFFSSRIQFVSVGIRVAVELMPETAARIGVNYLDTLAMDECEEYVYLLLHYDYFNKLGENYSSGV